MPELFQTNNERSKPSCLFSSFTENGYQVDAYMPGNSREPLEWLIRVYANNGEVFIEQTLPMQDDRKFSVSGVDMKTLEEGLGHIREQIAPKIDNDHLLDTSHQYEIGGAALLLTIDAPEYVNTKQLSTHEHALVA